MKIGREVAGGGENALVVLALALAIELLPPLGKVVQLGVEVHQQLNLAASAIQGVARGGIGENVVAAVFLHLDSALDQGLDVVAGHGDRQQAHGREHREAAAHVVGYHIGLVALLGGQAAQRAPAGIGHSHDAGGCLGLAHLLLKHVLEQAEGYRGLGGGARL